MCMMLYAGTDRMIPRRPWTKDAPDIAVSDLSGEETAVKSHFTRCEVQNIGSTSGCGCDFPNSLFQNGEWPYYDDPEDDPEQRQTEQYNRKALVELLSATGESEFELYALWWGSFTEIPLAQEEISLRRILETDFRFKEGGFYRVKA